MKKMDKPPIHLMDLARLVGCIEEKRGAEVAYKRVAYALGDGLGLRPEDVDKALDMANADIKDELKFKEIQPGLYMGNTIQNLAAESSEVAAMKGKRYIENVRDYRER